MSKPKVQFTAHGWDDYLWWETNDRKILKRVNALIEACHRDPFTGIGKPEGLRGELSGAWSRRITGEHRLVYLPETDTQVLTILACRKHYQGV